MGENLDSPWIPVRVLFGKANTKVNKETNATEPALCLAEDGPGAWLVDVHVDYCPPRNTDRRSICKNLYTASHAAD
jgi:hypothetical protein